jgi:type IV pilus assembly protein PilE
MRRQEDKSIMASSKLSRGFTLIEVLIVLTLIGILMAIAVPAYSDYVTSSKLTEGTANLSTMRAKLEQFYQDNRTYSGACAAGTGVAPSSELFVYSCGNLSQTTYTATATGRASVTGFVFTINETGAKATTATPPASGWNTGACWITKRSGSC